MVLKFIELRIMLVETTHLTLRFEFQSNLEPNQGVVVYMFNADCHVGVVYVL